MFTVAMEGRGEQARAHIAEYYESFDDIRAAGLDALIISGAAENVCDLSGEPFWQDMTAVLDWAAEHVTSTICSCAASHIAMQYFYGQRRERLPEKIWGLYDHAKTDRRHPLMQAVNTMFAAPHSRHNRITRAQFEAAQCGILAESDQAGVHIAVSPDLFRFVFLQGHLEYDAQSLMKEYKREVFRAIAGERDWPHFPKHYFVPQSRAILTEYREKVLAALAAGNGAALPAFPEELLDERLFNTWRDTAKSIMNNWIGHVYQITNIDRKKPFMDGIDPADPFGIKPKRAA